MSSHQGVWVAPGGGFFGVTNNCESQLIVQVVTQMQIWEKAHRITLA